MADSFKIPSLTKPYPSGPYSETLTGAVPSTTGPADAGKVPILGPSGQLDPSFIPGGPEARATPATPDMAGRDTRAIPGLAAPATRATPDSALSPAIRAIPGRAARDTRGTPGQQAPAYRRSSYSPPMSLAAGAAGTPKTCPSPVTPLLATASSPSPASTSSQAKGLHSQRPPTRRETFISSLVPSMPGPRDTRGRCGRHSASRAGPIPSRSPTGCSTGISCGLSWNITESAGPTPGLTAPAPPPPPR